MHPRSASVAAQAGLPTRGLQRLHTERVDGPQGTSRRDPPSGQLRCRPRQQPAGQVVPVDAAQPHRIKYKPLFR